MNVSRSAFTTAAATLLLTLLSFSASAQNIQPGLWEFNSKVSIEGKTMPSMDELQKQLASLPPDQRKMVEDMMAKKGITPGGSDISSGTRLCITPEMAASNQMPVQNQGDCKSESSPRSGNTIKIRFSCSNPPSSGEGEVTITSPDSYTMKMAATASVQGQPQKININGRGKFVSSDCGSVKPAGSK